MKLSMTSTLAILTMAILAQSAPAQDYFDQLMAPLHAQDAQYERQLNAWTANYERENAQFVQTARQAMNDYRSPDQVVVNNYTAALRAQNPQWAAQMDSQLANNQRNFERSNGAMQDAFAEMNESSMNGWHSRNEQIDRGHRNSINTINDIGQYANPYTGERHELNYSHQGHQTDGYNNFYQDDFGNMHQQDNRGDFSELDEVDW